MIIAKVTLKNAAQMAVVENDQVIEALTTYASNHPLGVWILPRASWSRPHFPNTHSLNSVLEVLPIDSISITNQIAGLWSAKTSSEPIIECHQRLYKLCNAVAHVESFSSLAIGAQPFRRFH